MEQLTRLKDKRHNQGSEISRTTSISIDWEPMDFLIASWNTCIGSLTKTARNEKEQFPKGKQNCSNQKKVKWMWVGKTIRYHIIVPRKEENIAKTALKPKK